MAFSFRFFLFPIFSLFMGQARRGQGELPLADRGLAWVGAEGEKDWTVYNLTTIQ
jgi:hypothetical protein